MQGFSESGKIRIFALIKRKTYGSIWRSNHTFCIGNRSPLCMAKQKSEQARKRLGRRISLDITYGKPFTYFLSQKVSERLFCFFDTPFIITICTSGLYYVSIRVTRNFLFLLVTIRIFLVWLVLDKSIVLCCRVVSWKMGSADWVFGQMITKSIPHFQA